MEIEYSLRYDLLPSGEQHPTTASSTFYICAFPCARTKQKKPPSDFSEGGWNKEGGYLLSRLRSTIGVTGLNFSVRNGKRWNPGAITTRISWHVENNFVILTLGNRSSQFLFLAVTRTLSRHAPYSGHGHKFRAISKARLWHRCLYTCLLSTSSSLTTLMRKSNLVAGFALRCFQRLSDPDMDTRRCAWRHNR